MLPSVGVEPALDTEYYWITFDQVSSRVSQLSNASLLPFKLTLYALFTVEITLTIFATVVPFVDVVPALLASQSSSTFKPYTENAILRLDGSH